MKLFGAIDLHSNNNVTALINEKDEVVYRKRLPNDLKLILAQLAPHQSSIEGSWWSRRTIGTGWWMV
jgi:transposase